MAGEINDMGNMVCGAETTHEDEFLYSQEMSEFLDEWQERLEDFLSEEGIFYGRRRYLEYFAWALRKKIEEMEGI